MTPHDEARRQRRSVSDEARNDCGTRGEHPRQFSIAKLFALVAVWALASALAKWLSSARPMPDGWGYFLCVVAFFMLPVGLPLSILIIRGARAVVSLAIGLVVAVAMVLYYYFVLKRPSMTYSFPEAYWLLAAFAGQGAGFTGSAWALITAARGRRWLSVSGWAIAAAASACAFWLLRWMVLYAG